MPLEEFEDLLKGVAKPGTKGHEGRPQHGELISQLKHHVKVQPDEPIQTKPTEKECSRIWKSFSKKDGKNQHESSNSSSLSGGGGITGGSVGSTPNGNIANCGTYVSHYTSHKMPHPSLVGSGSSSSKTFSNTGDQNSNPVASNSSNSNFTNSNDNPPLANSYATMHNSVQGKYQNYNNHNTHHQRQSTLNYSNSLDGDPGGYNSRRSLERDANCNKTVDNTVNNSGIGGSPFSKNSPNANENAKSKDDDDDDSQETYLDPEEFTGPLPPQYVLSGVTKLSPGSKDLPLQLQYTKPVALTNSLAPLSLTPIEGNSASVQPPTTSSSPFVNAVGPSTSAYEDVDDQPGTSKALGHAPGHAPWDLKLNRNRADTLQLKDGYKSVASVTSGTSSATYMGRATPSSNDEVFGSVRAISPTLPSNAIMSKSPTIDGSQTDKPPRRGADRKKKSSRNVLRETVINPQLMPGYKGTEKDIDKLLEFVEGNQNRSKKPTKDKKQREGKLSKGNDKQVLSKAASLDENSLGYGSKKSEETASSCGSRSRNSKDVEKKNSANITKSTSSICGDDTPILRTSGAEVTKSPTPPQSSEGKSSSSSASSSSSSSSSSSKGTLQQSHLVNGGIAPAGLKPAGAKQASSNLSVGGIKSASPNAQKAIGTEAKANQVISPESAVADNVKSEYFPVAVSKQAVVPESRKGGFVAGDKNKSDDDRFPKPDEADGPYVLVQSKKKRERKKQQRESENFARSHPEQTRREGVRPRRVNTERRKSVGSVPGSENSECSDDDSVRSLPAGECTPRERIPKPCSSSGGTPQTSYADIARMSKDENGKPTTTPSTTTNSTTSTATPPAPVAVSVVPKTPTPTVKPSQPSVVAVVSPEDMNFPALSPSSSSEKTATTPVNTAVWPCKPRLVEMETPANKEKHGSTASNNTGNSIKSEDIPSSTGPVFSANLDKDGSFPPISAVNSNASASPSSAESQKCSSVKESNNVPINKSDSILAINNNNNNINSKEVLVSGKPILDASSGPKVDGVIQNGVFPRNNLIMDVTAKTTAPNKAKPEERKVKDKSTRVPEENSRPHVPSKPASENGDLYPAEPVVFCGGKFDSTQLPVGQKIGFEFGFGVIEALNDNPSATETSFHGMKPVEFASVVNPVEASDPPVSVVSSDKAIRSQDKSTALNHIDSCSTVKSVSLKNELPPVKPIEKSTQNPKNTQGQVSLASIIGVSGNVSFVTTTTSTTSVPVTQQQAHQLLSSPQGASPKEAPHAIVASVPQGYTSSKNSAVTTPLVTPTTPATEPNCTPISSSSPSTDSKALKENTPKVDIAQIFTPPKRINIPDTLHQAFAFMENYVSKLNNLSKEGKVSFHRVA